MKRLSSKYLLLPPLLFILSLPLEAQTIHLDASSLVPHAELTFSPRAGSFEEGSTFDVKILLDTRGLSVNGIEVRINFDKDRLEIVKPSSGQSIIGVWVEPPGYDNARGLGSYVGVVPNGIKTASGLVGTITFHAKKTGRARVTFNVATRILLNDGQGSEVVVDAGRADLDILPKAPEGVKIFSETHPFPSEWYTNNSPVISWERDPGVTGFSYALDDVPSTVPENVINTNETSMAFENLADGLRYFHIKAYKNGAWSTTGHFLIRIDTAPPAEFTPKIDFLISSTEELDRGLVSFFTTDNLSGVDGYEVGIIDKSQPTTVSPVFVQSESPFQVPITSKNLSVIVRAVDKAGNVRDVSIPVGSPSFLREILKDNLVYILLAIILAGFIGLMLHYLVGHHIIRYIRQAVLLSKAENRQEQPPPPPIPEKLYEMPPHYPIR